MNDILKMTRLVVVLVVASVATAHAERDEEIQGQVQEALRLLKQKDSTFEAALEKAHGYVIFPAVGKIGVVGVEHNYPSLMKYAVTFWRASVVLVNFGKSFGKVVV